MSTSVFEHHRVGGHLSHRSLTEPILPEIKLNERERRENCQDVPADLETFIRFERLRAPRSPVQDTFLAELERGIEAGAPEYNGWHYEPPTVYFITVSARSTMFFRSYCLSTGSDIVCGSSRSDPRTQPRNNSRWRETNSRVTSFFRMSSAEISNWSSVIHMFTINVRYSIRKGYDLLFYLKTMKLIIWISLLGVTKYCYI